MTISAKLLNGNIINRDADFSKYIETVSEAWVIEGFQVSANAVAKWKARVPCERSNGEKLFVLVINDNNIPIDWNGDVYINIKQSHIDNGELSSDDGTGIATIEVWTMPSKNALKLATKNGSSITDKRKMLKKVQDLETLISWLSTRTSTLEDEIGQILEQWAIDHLEESWIVWERYTLNDTLFKQKTPLLDNCTLETNVGDVADNTEIHIQRLWSWTASNQLNIKLKKVWEPTQNLIVEVRSWTQVNVSTNEAYWYGSTVIARGSIAYWNITTDFAEYTVTLDANFWGTEWAKYDIVLYQNWGIVNSTNYYVVACDSTQYSEAFSYVAVNGTTRVRSKLMPYCISNGFAQSLLCKVGCFSKMITDYTTITKKVSSLGTIRTSPAVKKGIYTVKIKAKTDSASWNYYYNLNIRKTNRDWALVWSTQIVQTTTVKEFVWNDLSFDEWDIIAVCWYYASSTTITISSIEIWPNTQGYPQSVIYKEASPTINLSNNPDGTIYTIPIREWRIGFSCSLKWNWSYATYVYIYKNWTQIFSDKESTTTPKTVYTSIDVSKNDKISRKFYKGDSSLGSNTATNVVIVTAWTDIPLKPTEVKNIGTIWIWTSFWEVNNEFKGWQFIWETTEVITWDITLWNAMGYLVVNYKGNALKIPYYL